MHKILIVDDERDFRKIYRTYLQTEGFEVLEASTGEDVLLHFGQQKIDVILLDIRMNKATDRAFLNVLSEAHPESKIIISSCYPTDFQKEIIDGAAGYYDKSSGCGALVSKIKAILGHKPSKKH